MRRGLAAFVIVLAACAGGDHPETVATTTTATTTSTTATTSDDRAPALTPEGTPLGPPGVGAAPRTPDPALGCAGLAAAGSHTESCAAAGAFTALVERADGSGALIAWVFEDAGGVETPVLSAVGQDEWATVTTGTVDLDDDGGDELLFGFRTMGTGDYLSIDIVSGGAVVAHVAELAQGSAQFVAGRLDTWSAVYGPDDPNCCPSSILHQSIEYSGNGYRVVAAESLPPDAGQPSQL